MSEHPPWRPNGRLGKRDRVPESRTKRENRHRLLGAGPGSPTPRRCTACVHLSRSPMLSLLSRLARYIYIYIRRGVGVVGEAVRSDRRAAVRAARDRRDVRTPLRRCRQGPPASSSRVRIPKWIWARVGETLLESATEGDSVALLRFARVQHHPPTSGSETRHDAETARAGPAKFQAPSSVGLLLKVVCTFFRHPQIDWKGFIKRISEIQSASRSACVPTCVDDDRRAMRDDDENASPSPPLDFLLRGARAQASGEARTLRWEGVALFPLCERENEKRRILIVPDTRGRVLCGGAPHIRLSKASSPPEESCFESAACVLQVWDPARSRRRPWISINKLKKALHKGACTIL